ncbi:MAG: MlaD family protein [Zoogloeaceae bacterium]|jgi:phospholipid/cholesterol/gamma-HCH transport system substrate-binding protein|nr:MlaD family protein [Zoogloeaceae bacterium]
MENRAHALLAGLFTLALLAATLMAFYAFGERSAETREFVLVTQQNVGGLNPQAPVLYRGIRVGKVQSIQLDPEDARNILIHVEAETFVPLNSATTARLAYQGITGLAHVLLEDGAPQKNSQPLRDDPLPRIQMQPSFLDRLEDSLPAILAETRAFLVNANELLDAQNRQRLERTLVHLESASQRMDASFAHLQSVFSEENTRSLAAAVRAAPLLMEDARKLVAHTDQVVQRAEKLLRDEGEAKVRPEDALIPKIRTTAHDLSLAARRFEQVLDTLEHSPQSLVFGAQPATPGPGEPGFVAPAATSPAAVSSPSP